MVKVTTDDSFSNLFLKRRRSFDDLSRCLCVNYHDRLSVYFDMQNVIKFAVHPDDLAEDRIPFIAYIGGDSREDLKAIAKVFNSDFKSYSIREGKRTKFSFELKLRGLKFEAIAEILQHLK